jgi:hypothetical protein
MRGYAGQSSVTEHPNIFYSHTIDSVSEQHPAHRNASLQYFFFMNYEAVDCCSVAHVSSDQRFGLYAARHSTAQARFILYSTRLDTVHVTQNGSIASDSIVVLHEATAGFAAKQQGSRVWWRFHESPAVFPHDGYARVLAHSNTQRAK